MGNSSRKSTCTSGCEFLDLVVFGIEGLAAIFHGGPPRNKSTEILLGATGIYLWFETYGERAIGVVLLAINLGVCVTLLVLIRTS
jgi:hypothetical protein